MRLMGMMGLMACLLQAGIEEIEGIEFLIGHVNLRVLVKLCQI
jgi:hypothetical protein